MLLCSSITFPSMCIIIIKIILLEEGNENYFYRSILTQVAQKVVFIPPPKVIDEQIMK